MTANTDLVKALTEAVRSREGHLKWGASAEYQREAMVAAILPVVGEHLAKMADEMMNWTDAFGSPYMATPHAVAKEIRRTCGIEKKEAA